MSALRPAALLVLASLPLGGCFVTPTDSPNNTRKSMVDVVVSSATGRDCSIVTFSETGTYCPERIEVDRSNVYCYRTLGEVNCHHIPDPHRNGHTALASPPPVRRQVN